MSFQRLKDESSRSLEFFYISQKRLVVMSILTFGLYELYWFFKNFEAIRRSQEGSSDGSLGVIVSVFKSIFSVFFCYGLFKKIYQIAREAGCDLNPSAPLNYALLYIVLFLSVIIDHLVLKYVGVDDAWVGIVSSLSGILLVIPVSAVHSLVVKSIQKKEPTRGTIKVFNFVEILMALLGVVGWIFTLAQVALTIFVKPTFERAIEKFISQELEESLKKLDKDLKKFQFKERRNDKLD